MNAIAVRGAGSAALREPQAADRRPWWQPQAIAGPTPPRGSTASRTAAALEGSRAAFYALVAFTFVLLLSPQAWFPVLKLIRIAFLAGGIAIAAHVMERTAHKQPITPLAPEIGIALALILWSTITIPMSYWPGGSIRLLTDQYLKAIAFFWLLGNDHHDAGATARASRGRSCSAPSRSPAPASGTTSPATSWRRDRMGWFASSATWGARASPAIPTIWR